MDNFEGALELFNIESLENETLDSLKSIFKKQILKAHPDKGGDAKLFDKLIGSYLLIRYELLRISGSKDIIENLESLDELKAMRPDEIIDKIFEEIVHDDFNLLFESKTVIESPGYSQWLKNKEGENGITDGQFGDATQLPPTFNEQELNDRFNASLEKQKPTTNTLIVHPDALAYVSGSVLGTYIIENNTSFTSNIFTNPEYTDVFSAFTSDNTIYDKLPVFTEKPIDFDSFIKERDTSISDLNSEEAHALHEFKLNAQEEYNSNISKLESFYTTPSDIYKTISNTVMYIKDNFMKDDSSN